MYHKLLVCVPLNNYDGVLPLLARFPNLAKLPIYFLPLHSVCVPLNNYDACPPLLARFPNLAKLPIYFLPLHSVCVPLNNYDGVLPCWRGGECLNGIYTVDFFLTSPNYIEMISIPCRFKSAAVTPSPEMSVPENVPSYIVPQPQDGLLDFRITLFAPCDWASFNA